MLVGGALGSLYANGFKGLLNHYGVNSVLPHDSHFLRLFSLQYLCFVFSITSSHFPSLNTTSTAPSYKLNQAMQFVSANEEPVVYSDPQSLLSGPVQGGDSVCNKAYRITYY